LNQKTGGAIVEVQYATVYLNIFASVPIGEILRNCDLVDTFLKLNKKYKNS
jgi:hypothetical protein